MVTRLGSSASAAHTSTILSQAMQRAAITASHLVPNSAQIDSPSLHSEKCHGSFDPDLTTIQELIDIDSKTRTDDEIMELYNLLLKKGMQKVSEAKDKDIVFVFGDTDAGKSTLVNFLSGCKMLEDEKERVLVDAASDVKEVTEIGKKNASCTLIPTIIPGIKIGNEEVALCDAAGLFDNRGIEVALANAVIANEIIKNARSVRFVMLFEYALLKAMHGKAWKDTMKLLKERFSNLLSKRYNNTLSLVITKTLVENLVKAKRQINDYANETTPPSLDLSRYAITYNPLDPTDRKRLLDIIIKLKAHRELAATKISLSAGELWEIQALGDKMAKKVEEHLKNQEVDEAVKKLQFTHGIARLGSPNLTKAHDSTTKVAHNYVQKFIDEIDPNNKHPFRDRIKAFKSYTSIKDKLKTYVNFAGFDRTLIKLIRNTEDKRFFASDQLTAPLVGSGATLLLGAGGFFFPPLWVLAALSGTGTGYSINRWWHHTDGDKDISAFFYGPQSLR